MRITLPRFEPIEPDLTGYSWLGQILYILVNSPRFRLVEDWVIELDNGLLIVVPRGFETDGASIPRWLWFLISPVGVLFPGAVLHDFGYQYGYLLSPATDISQYTEIFGTNIQVYVGKGSKFFDQLLRFITTEVSHATCIAASACYVLGIFGPAVWRRYRRLGPSAYNQNSLNLPGVMVRNS